MCVSFKVIGKNIREQRISQGISQETAAELLGISTLSYGRYERGERRIPLSRLIHLSILYNVSLEQLLSGSTTVLWSSKSVDKNDLGSIISLLSAGCSDSACSLMLDICQTIAVHDKQD